MRDRTFNVLCCKIFNNIPPELIMRWKVPARVMLKILQYRRHNFDVIQGQVVPCRKLSRIYRTHENDVARQVKHPR